MARLVEVRLEGQTWVAASGEVSWWGIPTCPEMAATVLTLSASTIQMLVRLFRLVGSVAFLAAPIVDATAQTLAPSADAASHVHATLRLTSGRTQYRQGELIQLQLQLTSDELERFDASTQIESRWSPTVMEQFHVTPANGAVDPLALYEYPFLSNERRFSRLPEYLSPWSTVWPTTVNLLLTDWLRFVESGHYKLSVRTFRVFSRPATPGGPQRSLALGTNEVEFDIVAADDAWQAQQLREIASQGSIDWPRLRALGTADAARFLARQYRGELHPFDREALLGLLGSPNRQAGVEEMHGLLRDPDFPVTDSFLQAMAVLDTPPPEATWPFIRARLARLRDQLSDMLPAKRGQALVTSRQTYMAGLEQMAAVKFGADQIGQIIQTFEQLQPNAQGLWLGQRWTQVSDQRWLPILKRLAARDVNYRQPGNPDLDSAVAMSRLALKRWYELDPQTAREAILQEITSPTPRFGAEALGILPDRALPAQQHIIAEHFASLSPPALSRPDPSDPRPVVTRQTAITTYQTAESHLASLLFRYADRDVLPEVLPAMKSRRTGWSWGARESVVAFLLKVDPDEAGTLLRTIVSDRPAGSDGGVSVLYQQIGSLIASPVLERFAIESLDDSNLIVATEALRYLRDHGSAQAEEPLFDRLVRWNAKWRDHGSDFAGAAGQPNGNQWEASFGMELAQTLTRGRGWLADEVRIRQLLPLALGAGARMDLTAAISQLQEKPIHIHFMGNIGSMFLIAQYQLGSVDELKNKLSQYPRGTVFVWSDHRSATYEILDHEVSRDMAQWSAAKGIHVEGL
jgi:hypothetical protein